MIEKTRNKGKKKKFSFFYDIISGGKTFSKDFIKHLKWGGKVALSNAIIFTVSGFILIFSFNPSFIRDQGLGWTLLGSMLFGGLFGVYFLSSNKLIRFIGVLMNVALLYIIFLPTNQTPTPLDLAVVYFMYIGMVVHVYVLLQYAKLLFEDLRKSGHWQRKDWP